MLDWIKSKPSFSIFLFVLGLGLGLAFHSLSVWGDFEAFLFDATLSGESSLQSLNCPVLISAHETGLVSASFSNSSDRQVEPAVRVHISDGLVTLMREYNTRIPIAPNASEQIEVPVTAEDAVWNRLILVRVYQFRSFPIPSRSGSCGILVADLGPFSGSQIVGLVFALSLVLMAAGMWLWAIIHTPLKEKARYVLSAMLGLALVVGSGAAASLFGWWMLSAFLLTIAVLLVVGVVTYFLALAG